MSFKPMLAGKAPSFDKIHYPVLATPKIDGIRCIVLQGKAVSRTLKPIQNHYIRETLETLRNLLHKTVVIDSLTTVFRNWKEAILRFNHIPFTYEDTFVCLDGELITSTSFQKTASDVMSHNGQPSFTYKVFDIFDFALPTQTYIQRMDELRELTLPSFCEKVLPEIITNAEELFFYEEQCLKDGYEGVMIRSLYSPYKFGRSTTKEGWLLKIKRFEDSDAIVIGFEELMHNDNRAKINALGYTERSFIQENLLPANTLGALIVKDIHTNQQFKIGTGFADETRVNIWHNQKNILYKTIKYKFQPYGVKDAPRCPIFLGFRDDIK